MFLGWMRECPKLLLGILVELTLTAKPWALFFSPWCSEHPWERLPSLSVQSKFVYRLVQYLLFWVWGKWKISQGRNPIASVSQWHWWGVLKALSFPNPSHLEKATAGTSGEPDCSPAVALNEEFFSPLPVPCPGFLNYSILTQRCYLPNTIPTHSCQFCLLNFPNPKLPSQALFPVLIALKLTSGP